MNTATRRLLVTIRRLLLAVAVVAALVIAELLMLGAALVWLQPDFR